MSDDLIKRLRRGNNGQEIEAADRIEQLERERDQWVSHAKNAIWSDSEELKLSEAKLAKAMEALRWYDDPSDQGDVARAALAELEKTK